MTLIHLLVEPPGCLLLLVLVGLVLWKRKPRAARAMVFGAVGLLWIASTSLCGGALLRSLQADEPLVPGQPWPGADAVVVLAAGTHSEAFEYGGPTVDPVTLVRLRYGCAVQRATGLPMLVTGGPAEAELPSVAALMRDVAEREFDVRVQWVEGRSADTWENAAQSAVLLREAGVERIYLVTHAWHMPRARACFEAQGLEVVAAPTGYRADLRLSLAAFLPSAKGIRDTAWACHEWIGRAYYALAKG